MRIGYDNHVFDETVAASTENASFPLTNITESRLLSDVFKMTATSGTVTITGTSLVADYAVIIGCNATSANVNGESFACTSGVDLIYFTSDTQNTWTFTFSGSANIEIAGLWLGQYTQMPPMIATQTKNLRDGDILDESDSSQLYIFEKPEKRVREYQVQFPFMTTAQQELIESFWLEWCHRQLIFDMWENDHDIQAPKYTYQAQTPIQISRSNDRFKPWATALTFRETK